MLSFNMLFFYFLLPLILMKFIMNFNHLLVNLLSLEFISLMLFFIFSLNIFYNNMDMVFMLYFLIMIVCEGLLGLCLLVMMSFYYGNDYMFLYNKLVC